MNDDNVEAALRAVLTAVDRVPEAALAAANATIGWRDLRDLQRAQHASAAS